MHTYWGSFYGCVLKPMTFIAHQYVKVHPPHYLNITYQHLIWYYHHWINSRTDEILQNTLVLIRVENFSLMLRDNQMMDQFWPVWWMLYIMQKQITLQYWAVRRTSPAHTHTTLLKQSLVQYIRYSLRDPLSTKVPKCSRFGIWSVISKISW